MGEAIPRGADHHWRDPMVGWEGDELWVEELGNREIEDYLTSEGDEVWWEFVRGFFVFEAEIGGR